MSCLSITDPSLAAEFAKRRSEGSSEWNRSGCLVPDPSISGHSSPFSPSPAIPSSPAESSSIGKNSDEDGEEDDGESEVKSPFEGSFSSSNMDALEEALPMRRGISGFYNGKSRSFACLVDASSSSSIKSIVKPENAYSRKRRNLLAHTLLSENKTKTSHLVRSHIGGGISKKSTSSSNLSKLALAAAITTTPSNISGLEEHKGLKLNQDLRKGESSPSSPLSPWGSYGSGGGGGTGSRDGGFSPSSPLHWRSYSLADLLQCGGVGTASNLESPDQVT